MEFNNTAEIPSGNYAPALQPDRNYDLRSSQMALHGFEPPNYMSDSFDSPQSNRQDCSSSNQLFHVPGNYNYQVIETNTYDHSSGSDVVNRELPPNNTESSVIYPQLTGAGMHMVNDSNSKPASKSTPQSGHLRIETGSRYVTQNSGQVGQSTGCSVRPQVVSRPSNVSGRSKSTPKASLGSTAQERSRTMAKNAQKQSPHHGTNSHSYANRHTNASAVQMDIFQRWYQAMQYYQFYANHQLLQPQGIPVAPGAPNTSYIDKTSNVRATNTSAMLPNSGSNRPTMECTQQHFGLNASGLLDYAPYFGHPYLTTAQLYSGLPFFLNQTGRRTPKYFPSPHIKALLSIPGLLLQVLPNRPLDGESASVEIIDMSELAHEAVAQATHLGLNVGESAVSNRLHDLALDQEAETFRDGFSSVASGLQSSGRLSSLHANGGGDDGEVERRCAAIVLAWSHTEHTLYPGPLSRSNNVTTDVLTYLRQTLEDMQDRMPVDWESAALLIAYLSLLVRNNGNIQPCDVVNLLLDGHEPRTEDLRARCDARLGSSTSLIGGAVARTLAPNEPFASQPPSEPPSGRQSPYTPCSIVGSGLTDRPQVLNAASENGSYLCAHALLRRASQTMETSSSTHNVEAEDRKLDAFRKLLMRGTIIGALDYACREQLWGHAFTLAQRISQDAFERVMGKFLTRAVYQVDPILTFYQISSGEMPQAVTSAAYGRGADIGEWRPHLATLLVGGTSQPKLTQSALERLGDSLLSRRLVYAAHLCYLLIGPLCKQSKSNRQPTYHLPDKIWLLGVPVATTDVPSVVNVGGTSTPQLPVSQSPLTAPTEAIQLTEVYEYAMKLANKNYRLPQLLPFKLVYVIRLMDAGLLNKASRYLSVIGTELLLEADSMDIINCPEVPPILYSLVDNCLRLAEPLQNHCGLDQLETMSVGLTSSRIMGTPFSAQSNHPRNFTGSSTMYTRDSVGGTWVERLRDLHDLLNRKLGRPSYGVVDLGVNPAEQPAQSMIPPTKAEASSPVLSNVPHLPREVVPSEYLAPQQSHFGQHVDSPTSGSPVSAYLVRNQPQHMENSVYLHSHTSQSATTTDAPIAYSTDSYATQPLYYAPGAFSTEGSESMRMGNRPESDSATKARGYQATVPELERSQHIFSYGGSDPVAEPKPSPSNSVPHLKGIRSSAHNSWEHTQPTSHPGPNQSTSLNTASAPGLSFHVPIDGGVSSNAIFVPAPNFSPTSDTSGTGMSYTFDYFANTYNSPVDKVEGKSRTASGGSQISAIAPYSHSMPSSHPTGGTRSRHNSGMIETRCSSGPFDRQSIANNPSQIPNTKHLGDIHPQTTIKEERPCENSEPKPPTSNQPQPRDGWFGGLWSRISNVTTKNIHLPDDKNPSIVWNEEMRKWLDTNNPETANAEPHAPPPMIPNSNEPGATTVAASSTLFSRGNYRPRYVNPLSNHTYDPCISKTDVPFRPPLPPSLSASPDPENRQHPL